MALRRTTGIGRRSPAKAGVGSASSRAKTLRREMPAAALTAPRGVSAQPMVQEVAALDARQVLDEIVRRLDVAAANAYALALCLRELSRPERYRGELGFKSFEELLEAHAFLPTR